MPKTVRIASIVAALHILVLSFFMSKPPAEYSLFTCVGTVAVWGMVRLVKKEKRMVGIIIGFLIALVIQQTAFYIWGSAQKEFWWPVVQFLSLQLVVLLSLDMSSDPAF